VADQLRRLHARPARAAARPRPGPHRCLREGLAGSPARGVRSGTGSRSS
jgi:hypothetical protein